MIEAIRQNGSSSYWSKLERGEVLPSEFEAGFSKELEEVAGQECKTEGLWLLFSEISQIVSLNRYPKPLPETFSQIRDPNMIPKHFIQNRNPK